MVWRDPQRPVIAVRPAGPATKLLCSPGPSKTHSLHPLALAPPRNAVVAQHKPKLLNLVKNFQSGYPDGSAVRSLLRNPPRKLHIAYNFCADLPQALSAHMRECPTTQPGISEAFGLRLWCLKHRPGDGEVTRSEVAKHDASKCVAACQLLGLTVELTQARTSHTGLQHTAKTAPKTT